MDMTGEQLIALPQQRVWEALNDPQVLKDCIPGCEAMEKVSDTEYRVVLSAAVGPVKAKFNGKLLLSDLNPPNSYALSFEGSGGAAGFGKGDCKVSLSEAGGGTRLGYTCHATIGGKLAQVGSRLIDGVARKMADDFFAKFNERVVPAPQPMAAAASPGKSKIPLWAWVVGIVVLVLLALFVAKSTGGH
jgi:carbon monoxide dehydrogenase subunit G